MGKLDGISRNETLRLAMAVGSLLLEHGAATVRVQDQMIRVCRHFGMENVDVFVTPAFIILGDTTEVGKNLVHRVAFRGRNLNVLCVVNKFIHNLDTWDMDFDATLEYLENAKAPLYGRAAVCLFAGIAAGSFAIVLGGNVFDFLAAFVTGVLTMAITKKLDIGRYGSFWANCTAGIIMGLLGLLACKICPKCDLEMVAVGSLMPFIPGLAFTNGLTDVISGDFISGNSRVTEAIITALALVFGLGSTIVIAVNGI